MPVCLGIDPDSQYIAMAIGSAETVLGVCSIKVPGAGKGGFMAMVKALNLAIPAFVLSHDLDPLWPSKIIIEGQKIYAGEQAQPNDLIKLAQLAGISAGICSSLYPSKQIIIPQPREWKGSVPKRIHQARLYKKLGWGYKQTKTYAYPINPTVGKELNRGDWKHVGDAIGLMQWGAGLDTAN
jgi:hypothetical protein